VENIETQLKFCLVQSSLRKDCADVHDLSLMQIHFYTTRSWKRRKLSN